MVKKVNYENLNREEIISEIMKKKEFSNLPRRDVELVYDHFEDEEFVVDRIKKSRELLMKMYTVFVSDKLLNVKNKYPEWFLSRHKSTKERLGHYESVYRRVLEGLGDEISLDLDTSQIAETRPSLPNNEEISKKIKGKRFSVIDFGCGVNGFSYEEFLSSGFNVKYLGIEPVGQLVELQNFWFEKNGFDAKCVKASLFDLKDVKRIVREVKGCKVGFFFKVFDSLEMLKRDYSKEVLKDLVPMFNRCVVSWATKSLGDRKRIFANKKWLKDFIEKQFRIVDEFEIGGENYLIFNVK